MDGVFGALHAMALMTLDVYTLTFAGGIVAFASGLFLSLHWWQAREDRAALWWGAASCASGIGITMLALPAILPAYLSTIAAPLMLDVCAASMWAAARIFNRGSIELRPFIVAVAVWIAILAVMGAIGQERLAAASGLGISASLYATAAIEFWLGRAERLRGRWPMIAVLSLDATALVLAAVDIYTSEFFSVLPSLNRFGLIHIVGLIYSGGSAISLVTMLKDRSEIKQKAAALIDPLTGLANRRAFTDRAPRLLDGNSRDGVPISLLAFDLDRFKKVNDTFGHPTGDMVLQIFADILSRAARSTDVAARIGGEEFALVLPGCDDEAALAIARHIRSAFQNDARLVNGERVGATVSVGVATAPEHGRSLADIIASADSALYRAKSLGRNRVVLASGNSPDPGAAIITRIA